MLAPDHAAAGAQVRADPAPLLADPALARDGRRSHDSRHLDRCCSTSRTSARLTTLSAADVVRARDRVEQGDEASGNVRPERLTADELGSARWSAH